MTVRILLVDDHPMIRQGLHSLLSDVSDFQIIDEASDGLEAIRKIELTKPDILIMDMMMPNLNGLEVLSRIKKISPNTRTIIFSMQSAEPYVVEALRAGAAGYILKETGPGELISAIQSVSQGYRYLSEQLSERIERGGRRVEDAPMDLYQTLTAREREILQLTVEGKSSSEIGEKLGISPRTVEVHRSKLMKKLALHNHTELIRYAIKRGILPINY